VCITGKHGASFLQNGKKKTVFRVCEVPGGCGSIYMFNDRNEEACLVWCSVAFNRRVVYRMARWFRFIDKGTYAAQGVFDMQTHRRVSRLMMLCERNQRASSSVRCACRDEKDATKF